MASERGTKRTDPDTGKKFYDLNQDPIVSPYTGKSYPRSFFDTLPSKPAPAPARKTEAEVPTEEEEVEDTAAPEIVSLEEADAEESGDDDTGACSEYKIDMTASTFGLCSTLSHIVPSLHTRKRSSF